MNITDNLDRRVDELGLASRRAAMLSALGVLTVLAALGYAVLGLRSLESQRASLSGEISVLEKKAAELSARASDLETTQSNLLDFLADVTAKESILLVDVFSPSDESYYVRVSSLMMDNFDMQ